MPTRSPMNRPTRPPTRPLTHRHARRRSPGRSHRALGAAGALGLASLAALAMFAPATAAGCYEKRVTRGQGIGSDRATIHESDTAEQGPLDALGDAIFGPANPKPRGGR